MDEQAETRLKVARDGLAAYAEWMHAEIGAPLSMDMLSDLASAARWYVESLDQADVTVGEC